MLAAVAQDGRALQFARQALRSDREIVLCKLTGGRGTLAVDKYGGLTIEEWIWPGTQATGPCHGARSWRTVCAETNDDRTEFKYLREDQGQISTASLVAMQTDTTVQSLDLKFSYFGKGGSRCVKKNGSTVEC